MAWRPISFIPPQFESASGTPYVGGVLKAYAEGTTTNIPIATDSTGATQATSVVINANGNVTQGGSVIIPHIQQNYKLALYPNQAAADANSGAVWTVDNIKITGFDTPATTTITASGATLDITQVNTDNTSNVDLAGSSLTITAVTAPAGILNRRIRVRVTGSNLTFIAGAGITVPNGFSAFVNTGDVFVLVPIGVNTVRIEEITPVYPETGLRNFLINGAFDIWQSGTSISSGVLVNTYTADQWIAYAVGAAITVSRSVGGGFTAGTNCLLFTGAASNTYVDLLQRFEAAEVQKFKNGNITVSARIFNGTGSTIAANSLTFTVSCPTATDNWAGANQRLGTTLTHAAISNSSWGQVSVTFNPSAYGDIDKGMAISLRFNALLAGQTIRVSEVQLKSGGNTTPYEHRSADAERFLCMKFYQTIGRGISGWLNAVSQASFNVVLPVPMRTNPTVSFLASAWLIYRNIGNSNFPAPLTIVDASNDTTGVRMTFSHGGAGTVNELWGSIQSDVIALNARL